MWRNTVEIIRKNPKMLIGFTIPVIVGLVSVFPLYRSIVLTLLGQYSRIDEMPNFLELVRSFAIGAPFVYLLMGVFVLPPLYGYVYTAVTGEQRVAPTKEDFIKYSWRVVLKSFLALLMLLVVSVVLFLFLAVPYLGFALYMIAFSMWSVFWVISLTSVIAEDRFIDSMPNTYFVGKRYYLRMYFTAVIVMIPSILVSGAFLLYFHSVNWDIAYVVPQINLPSKLLALIFIFVVSCLSVYYVFAQAFLFTYSMKNYLIERDKLDEEETKKAAAEQGQEPEGE